MIKRQQTVSQGLSNKKKGTSRKSQIDADTLSSSALGKSSKNKGADELAIEEDEQAQVYEIFRRFDFSKKGRVETKELPNILRLLNHNIGEDEDSKLRYMIDKKNRGFFVMNDLITLLTQVQFYEDSQDELLRSLQDLDNDADGFITVKELTDYLKKLAEPLTDNEMQEFLKLAVENDTDRPDLIDIKRIAGILLPKIEIQTELTMGLGANNSSLQIAQENSNESDNPAAL